MALISGRITLIGDLAAVLEILGEVDDGHPAFAKGALDPVAPGEGVAEPGDLGDLGSAGGWQDAGVGGGGGAAVQAEERPFGQRRLAIGAGVRRGGGGRRHRSGLGMERNVLVVGKEGKCGGEAGGTSAKGMEGLGLGLCGWVAVITFPPLRGL